MAFGSSQAKSNWGRYLRFPTSYNGTTLAAVANRAFLCPLTIPRLMTLDQIVFGVGVVNGNAVGGIYADKTDTPVGGKLLVSASSIPVALPTVFSINKQLAQGTYWLVVMFDGAVATLSTALPITILPDPFSGCLYDNAAGFALLDPCPAVTADNTASPIGYVRIKSVDDT